jgi:site-specific DNA recombinase
MPASQLKLLKEYAAARGFAVAQEYVDVETAKETGRAAFGEMVAYLKAHPFVSRDAGREDRPTLPQP